VHIQTVQISVQLHMSSLAAGTNLVSDQPATQNNTEDDGLVAHTQLQKETIKMHQNNTIIVNTMKEQGGV
jgi:hypothetical protein